MDGSAKGQFVRNSHLSAEELTFEFCYIVRSEKNRQIIFVSPETDTPQTYCPRRVRDTTCDLSGNVSWRPG